MSRQKQTMAYFIEKLKFLPENIRSAVHITAVTQEKYCLNGSLPAICDSIILYSSSAFGGYEMKGNKPTALAATEVIDNILVALQAQTQTKNVLFLLGGGNIAKSEIEWFLKYSECKISEWIVYDVLSEKFKTRSEAVQYLQENISQDKWDLSTEAVCEQVISPGKIHAITVQKIRSKN